MIRLNKGGPGACGARFMTVYVDMAREGKVGEPIFGIYDQEALDREYNNRAKIPNAAEQVEDWLTRGEEARGCFPAIWTCPMAATPGKRSISSRLQSPARP